MHQIASFHENLVDVVNRDDGRVALELSLDGNPTGVVLITAETAVELGKVLQSKGQFLLDELKDAVERPGR